MLKQGPSKVPSGTPLIISGQELQNKLIFVLAYSRRDNQKLIKAPYFQYDMHSV